MDRSENEKTFQKTETKYTNSNNKFNKSNKKEVHICLNPAFKKNAVRHYMRDFNATTDDYIKGLIKALSEEKKKGPPSKSPVQKQVKQ